MTSVPPEEPQRFPPTAAEGPAYPMQVMRNGLGTAALVLGIASLVFMVVFPPLGVILGILGLVFGIIGVRRAGRGEATNRGQAMAGWITGGIGMLVSVALLAIVGSFIFTHRQQIDTYTQCLRNAHDQHARDVCQTQFQNSIRGR